MERVKELEDVVWCGDGRFDSIEHLAKDGTYSMLHMYGMCDSLHLKKLNTLRSRPGKHTGIQYYIP